MTLETDLVRIKERSESQDERNWKFRRFLKDSALPGEKIDEEVHALVREVTAKIDCAACANCCKVMTPLLESHDVVRLARHLNMSEAAFRGQYLQKEKEEDGHALKGLPCPFLKNNRCSVYDARPDLCRSYPHLQNKGFVPRLWQAIENCAVCPIVFNVYERLKLTLWHHRSPSEDVDAD